MRQVKIAIVPSGVSCCCRPSQLRLGWRRCADGQHSDGLGVNNTAHSTGISGRAAECGLASRSAGAPVASSAWQEPALTKQYPQVACRPPSCNDCCGAGRSKLALPAMGLKHRFKNLSYRRQSEITWFEPTAPKSTLTIVFRQCRWLAEMQRLQVLANGSMLEAQFQSLACQSAVIYGRPQDAHCPRRDISDMRWIVHHSMSAGDDIAKSRSTSYLVKLCGPVSNCQACVCKPLLGPLFQEQ
jgi:hypothetical protein